jgi:hypothetical protein
MTAFAFSGATKLYGDAGFVVADYPSGHLPDCDHFAYGRFDSGLEGKTAQGKIQHFAMNGIAAAARELGKLTARATLVAAKGCRLRTSLLGDDFELLGEARLFER